jgi:hypothetical protein
MPSLPIDINDVALQPDTQTGDIVFVLQLRDHPKFKRKGDDLFVQHTLTLPEALCGFQFPLTHLDGRLLLIKSSPGEIIKPGVLHFFILLAGLQVVAWVFSLFNLATEQCSVSAMG